MYKIIAAMLTAAAVCAAVMPLVIKLTKKLKFRQTILSYVDNHQAKSGTPTMGGMAFMLALLVAGAVFFEKTQSKAMLMLLVVTVGYGIVGFLDDFIKVFYKRNEGLSPLQKIIFQLLIAVILAVYAYMTPTIGDKLYLPFTLKEVHIGWWAIPLYIFLFLALTNSVNLTDGLDGLASSVTIVYLLFFGLIIAATSGLYLGDALSPETLNLLIYTAALIGSLIGFLCFNGYPARIFMGDTGSLALGGGLGCLAIFSSQGLTVPIIGIMYVLTALSVIIQVLHYKRTKKRVFIMAPLHHHFERKGVHEVKIVIVYAAVTFAVGALVLLVTTLIALT